MIASSNNNYLNNAERSVNSFMNNDINSTANIHWPPVSSTTTNTEATIYSPHQHEHEVLDTLPSISSFFSSSPLDDELSSISTSTSSNSFKIEDRLEEDFEQLLMEETPPELVPLFKFNSFLLTTDGRWAVWLSILVQHVVFLFYGYYFLNLFSTIVLLSSTVLAWPIKKLFDKNMQKRKPEVICAEERNAFRSGFTLFLIRFIILRQHKIMLLPLYIILAIATTKFTKYSVLWSFTPLYYTSALFIVDSVYIFACFGFSELCVTSLLENIIFIVVILLISFSIAIIGIDQKSNVKALENTSIQLKMSLHEKQKFLRSISHEFRSPCLSSLGSVELLRETSLTEYQRDMVETIASADEILLNLIEDILKAAKNEHEKKAGHVEETTKTMKNCQEFSLGYCVKTIGNIIKSYASPFNVSVVVKIDDQLKDMVVRGNLTRIHQILANLLTNAVKASKCGGTVQLICDVELHDKSASAVTTEQTIVFTVIDHGVGIPKDKQHMIFEPFTQLHNVNETVYKGSGLGLNTVLHYVQALRGSIHLHSEINEGTEFAVSLPLEVVNANSSSNDGAKDGVVVKKHLFKQAVVSNPENTTIFNSNAKIIIADDNSVNRKVIGKLIESMGFEYDVASNGRQLLDGFDETRHKLVFTDINMPDINGVDVAKILRSKFKERVKIVALTGDAMFQPPPHLFDVVILKPCQKSVLKSCIDSVSFD